MDRRTRIASRGRPPGSRPFSISTWRSFAIGLSGSRSSTESPKCSERSRKTKSTASASVSSPSTRMKVAAESGAPAGSCQVMAVLWSPKKSWGKSPAERSSASQGWPSRHSRRRTSSSNRA